MSFIGHDDLLYPNYLAVMDELILKYPTAGVYQVHFRYIDERGDTIRSCKPMDATQMASDFLAFFLCNMYELSIGQMVRSKDYDDTGGIPDYPNLLFADLELQIRLLEKGFRAASSDECCAYRSHSRSTTRSSSTLSYYHAFNRLLDFCLELKASGDRYSGVLSRYALGFLKLYCKSLAHHLL